ncbi:MAG: hypothetical protein K0S70_4676 [Microbacterium sp.]|nr:hypothetical protein [Microbacterium sp.]
MSVVLKKAPDTSWKVPSWLKCSCHHSGSVVVTIEARMPPTSTTRTTAARCIVERVLARRARERDAVSTSRGVMRKEGEETVDRTARLIFGHFP